MCGGKVSLYNETPTGSIKPTPLIGVLGLVEKNPMIPQKISENDYILLVGDTKDEMGGSEYYEYIHKFIGGKCPVVDFTESKKNMKSVLSIIQKQLVKSVHDCSKGGLATAVSELCITNQIGCHVSLENVPLATKDPLPEDKILFSESHSRYLLVFEKNNLKKFKIFLSKTNHPFQLLVSLMEIQFNL